MTGCFLALYNTLKFGLLWSLYSRALELELVGRGHRVTREFGVRVSYKGIDIGLHRLDLVVDDTTLKPVGRLVCHRYDAEPAPSRVPASPTHFGPALGARTHTESIR